MKFLVENWDTHSQQGHSKISLSIILIMLQKVNVNVLMPIVYSRNSFDALKMVSGS